jgi:hypothetical protein
MACILINDEVQSTFSIKRFRKSYTLYSFYRRETNDNFS